GLKKEELDAFALRSHQLAIEATRTGRFEEEIVAIEARNADGPLGEPHTADEGIRFDASLDSIAGVKLIAEGGVCTAASASQICAGGGGVRVGTGRGRKAVGVKPLARVHHLSVLGHDPIIMLEAPIPATERALAKAGMKIDDIDLFEVNEAFAPVPLAWLQATGADPARLNVNGGAIALGHPLGASGTKLMTTLLHALQHRGMRWGLQTMCECGGLANGSIVERLWPCKRTARCWNGDGHDVAYRWRSRPPAAGHTPAQTPSRSARSDAPDPRRWRPVEPDLLHRL